MPFLRAIVAESNEKELQCRDYPGIEPKHHHTVFSKYWNIYKLDERKTTYSEYGQKDIGVARFHVFKKNRLELRIEVRVASGQLHKGKGKGIGMDKN